MGQQKMGKFLTMWRLGKKAQDALIGQTTSSGDIVIKTEVSSRRAIQWLKTETLSEIYEKDTAGINRRNVENNSYKERCGTKKIQKRKS